jgi:hypothetical protein
MKPNSDSSHRHLIAGLVTASVILLIVSVNLMVNLEYHPRTYFMKASGELRSLKAAVRDYRFILEKNGRKPTAPPGGDVSQQDWKPWRDEVDFGPPNAPNNGVHACSILWTEGSFYDDAGDNTPEDAARVPTGNTHYDLRVLSTPIGALMGIPIDPFKNGGASFSSQYDFFGLDLEKAIVLRSLGPDGDADAGCGPEGFHCACIPGECLTETGKVGIEFGEGFSSVEEALAWGRAVYSPTNGAQSSGDIWRYTDMTLPPDHPVPEEFIPDLRESDVTPARE